MNTGYTFVEKALARAAGVESARSGAILDVRPDLIFSHDNTAAIRRIFEAIGATRMSRPERVAITLDHAVPAPTTQHAQNHAPSTRRTTLKSASGYACRGLLTSSR